MLSPFDAVLLISFGGPQGPDEIRPFLRNVLRARSIPEARLKAVAKHYERFGGVSPLTSITMRQAEGLRNRLAAATHPLPVYVGMRNWHPFLEDTLIEMANAGIRRVLALTLAAHHSYSSCGQYKQNVIQARQHLRSKTKMDLEFTYIADWHSHDGFIKAHAHQIKKACNTLAPALQTKPKVVFTAHSIPQTMAAESRYEEDLRESAVLIANELGQSDWALVYQSRSGRPEQPWLEPDVCEYLKKERERGLKAVVLSPLGFVADHIEVLYDLDYEAGTVCREIGLVMRRAAAVNDHPLFLDMLADTVNETILRYRRGRPLPIATLMELSLIHI